jgi:photosystem II stability/assembly factor-like uncharacterized protein
MSMISASIVYIAKNFSSSSSLLMTSNGGTNWISVYTGFPSSTTDVFFVNSANGYAAGLDIALAKTVNGGANWTNTGITGVMQSVFFPSVSTGYAAGNTSAGFRTTNSGSNWTTMSFPLSGNYRSIFFTSETTGYIAGQLGVGSSPLMMKTTNGGINWIEQPTGMAQYLNAVHFPNVTTGYACGRVGLIIKTTTGGVTGINQISETAYGYRLLQNYPNPFNPSTTIVFNLPFDAVVKLTVYDVFGCEVAKLVDERKKAGTYSVNFHIPDLASGIYLYKLTAGEFIQSRKMLLIK